MSERTKYLREETLSGRNKCLRTAVAKEWTVKNEPYSLSERKALSLKKLLDNMPIFIGEKELVVGTKTFFKANEGNENGQNKKEFGLYCGVPYVNEDDIKLFLEDQSFRSVSHYTPDMGILLNKGIAEIIADTKEKLNESGLKNHQIHFLKSVIIAYEGFKNLFLRYAEKALELSNNCEDITQKNEWYLIYENCKYLSEGKPKNFLQAVQLLWLGHLVTIIESFEFINYGRLDVILQPFVTNETDEEIRQVLECLLLKMYDQVDINTTYLGSYAAQLVVTLGGVLANGENAVNRVSMQFLNAIDSVRLPEPEFNLRINSKNPKEFLEKAAQLTVTGCNFIAYYNDDLFVKNLIDAGIKQEWARCYGFDLCQDINIPGIGHFFLSAQPQMGLILLNLLKKGVDYSSFEELISAFNNELADSIKTRITAFNKAHKSVLEYRDGDQDKYFKGLITGESSVDWGGRSIMSPLPFLSALYHGCIETATDIVLEGYPCKDKGAVLATATEAVNSLAAIKKVVYDDKKYSLKEVVEACNNNFEGEEILRKTLWSAPKWGNDDDYVDLIAKEVLERGLLEILKYNTVSGGRHLAGIHQAHPVATGLGLGATPEGRFNGEPIAVTLTPESGTMKNGPTAALSSGAKIESKLIQWNFCIMINYFSSAFSGNSGKDVFISLLEGYFNKGGMQHQPNVLDVNELKAAQLTPENYKDLIVRLWGVSAHFVDLPINLQNEMIERFS